MTDFPYNPSTIQETATIAVAPRPQFVCDSQIRVFLEKPRQKVMDWEKQVIVDYYQDHPDDGYRRVTYMMMDDDIVAASASSVYRVLNQAGVLRRWERKKSHK